MLFNPVTKARVGFYDRNSNQFKDFRKVLLNPTEISYSTGYKLKRKKGAEGKNSDEGIDGAIQRQGPLIRSARMTLHFDLTHYYDALVNKLMVASANMIDKIANPAAAFVNLAKKSTDDPDDGMKGWRSASDFFNISIYNENVSIYPALQSCAEHNQPICFLWGPNEICGYITDFSPRLTYFSPQGVPLRAEVSLSFEVVDRKMLLSKTAEARFRAERSARTVQEQARLHAQLMKQISENKRG